MENMRKATRKQKTEDTRPNRLDLLLILIILILSGCTAGQVVTQQDFDSVAVGSSISQIQERIGSPYEIERLDNGTEVYHYIERIQVGPNATAQNDFALTVSKGLVVDKKCSYYSPPLVQIGSP